MKAVGVLKTFEDIRAAQLVGHHLRTIVANTQGGGASVVNYKGGPSGEPGVGATNDAAGMAYLTRMRCFDGPSNGYHASIGFPFWGRLLGLLFTRRSQSHGITCQIDGVPYKVHVDQLRSNVAVLASQDQAHAIVATDLDDGPHWGEVYVSPDPAVSGAIVREVDITGILVDRGAGYSDPPRFDSHSDPVTITNTATAIVKGPTGSGTAPRAVRKIIVYNLSASPNRIKLVNGALVWSRDLAPASSPGDSDEFEIGATMDDNWTIQDTQNNGKYVTVFSW